MDALRAEFLNTAKRSIKKLDTITQQRIKERIDRLEGEPFPQDIERVEKVKGEKVFRVRVGSWRILYLVLRNPDRLVIVDVDKRSRVYD